MGLSLEEPQSPTQVYPLGLRNSTTIYQEAVDSQILFDLEKHMNSLLLLKKGKDIDLILELSKK